MRGIYLLLLVLPLAQPLPLRSIQDLQWQNRVLLYFPEHGETLEEKGYEIGISERKLIWFEISDSLVTNYQNPLHPDFGKTTSQLYRQGPRGSWVLIGLDGSVKASGKEKPEWMVVFAKIDSMPMRRGFSP